MPGSRPILAARVDREDAEWVVRQALVEGLSHADFIRRLVCYARLNMPVGWHSSEDVEADSESGVSGGGSCPTVSRGAGRPGL